MDHFKTQLQNVDILRARFTKTLNVLVPTFNYVDTLDESERDYCEETFYQLSPCYMYMYSVVMDGHPPDAYKSNDAQLEMFDQIKNLAQVSALAYKKMRVDYEERDNHYQGFYALLETYLLMYYAYVHGMPA